MRRKTLIIIGAGLIAMGTLQILSYYLNINFWAVFISIGLILLGIFLLLRPKMSLSDRSLKLVPIYEIQRYDAWTPVDEDIFMFVGDIDLDFSRARLLPGETTIRIFSFVSEIRLLANEHTKISISSFGFLNQTNYLGDKKDLFFTPSSYQSEFNDAQGSDIRLEVYGFVVELNFDTVKDPHPEFAP